MATAARQSQSTGTQAKAPEEPQLRKNNQRQALADEKTEIHARPDDDDDGPTKPKIGQSAPFRGNGRRGRRQHGRVP